MKHLTTDLLEGFATNHRLIVAALLGLAAIAVAFYTPAGVLQVVSTAAALIAIVIILRITGPQDAQSFRLYRPER